MPHSEPTPILLTDDAFYSVLAAARALRAAGYAPWLAVYESGTYAARSRATAGTVPVPNPSLDSEGFVRELATAATKLSAAAVLPTAEHDLIILAGRDADFAGIPLGTPSPESVELATDKALLPKLAAGAGLRTPPTKKVDRGDIEGLRTFGLPAIIKPLRSRIRHPDGTMSPRSSYYLSSEQVQVAPDKFPDEESLVQQYISGTLYSVSGVSWAGELICALHQESIRIWPERAGGSAYAITTPPDVKLEQGVSRLLQAIGWSGPFQAQFLRSPDGEYYLIDLNPRIYGSLALAVGAGLNLPAIWVNLLLGRRPQVNGYRVGVRFRQEDKDIRVLTRALLAGGKERRHALQAFVPRRGTVHAIASLRDPMPLLTSVVRGATHVGSSIRGVLPAISGR